MVLDASGGTELHRAGLAAIAIISYLHVAQLVAQLVARLVQVKKTHRKTRDKRDKTGRWVLLAIRNGVRTNWTVLASKFRRLHWACTRHDAQESALRTDAM
jgi:hypothetical protein